MPGGLIQLASRGAQDVYLSGNPQVTFFKVVYRRHTNFSMEYIRSEFTTSPKLSTTDVTKINFRLERNGDLLHDTYLVFDLPLIYTDKLSSFKWIKNLAQRLVNFAEISIAGQRVDIKYGQWMNIWNELTLEIGKKRSYDNLIGNLEILRPGIFHTNDSTIIPSHRLYLPLDFWFCQNAGLALPLISLQYTDVFLTIEFNPLNDLFTIGQNPALSPDEFFNSVCQTDVDGDVIEQSPENKALFTQLCEEGWDARNVIWRFINGGDKNAARVWRFDTFLEMNYIFLDTEERRRFAQVSHEYLITQTDRRLFTGLMAGTNIVELKYQHPAKEMMWVFQRQDIYKTNDWFNYTIVNKLDQYKEILKISYQNSFFESTLLDHNNVFLTKDTTKTFIEPIVFQSKTVNTVSDDFLNIMLSAKLIFNGNDRFDEKDYKFFNALMSFKYHTNKAADGVQLYSFGLDPENIHPSGSVNMSALNKIELFTILKTAIDPNIEYDLFVYVNNFNILRIMGGIGQLAYQNA